MSNSNFHVSVDAFKTAAAAAKKTIPLEGERLKKARKQFDVLLIHVSSRILDLLRIVAPTRTLQVEHLHTLMRVASILEAPICDKPQQFSSAKGALATRTRARGTMFGGTDTVMTGSFFDPNNVPDQTSYHFGTGSQPATYPNVEGSGGMVRYATVSTFPTDAYHNGMPPVGPQAPVNGLVPVCNQSGGGGRGVGWLTDDTFTLLLQEYRIGTKQNLRIAEGLRSALRFLIEANVVAALASRKGEDAAVKCTSAERIAKVERDFRIQLQSRSF